MDRPLPAEVPQAPGTMRLIYCRSRTVGGMLIRLLQWIAPWNHVAVLTEEGTVINAIYVYPWLRKRGKRQGGGVIEEKFFEWAEHYSNWTFRDIPCPNPTAGIAALRTCLGMKYDWRGLVHMISSRFGIRTKPGTTHCVALVEGVGLPGAGKRRIHPEEDPARITVQQSFVMG